MTEFGTRCDKSRVQDVTKSDARCDKVCYKMWQDLVQGVTKYDTRCK